MPSEWQVECLAARIASLSAEVGRVKEKQPLHGSARTIYSSLLRVLDELAELLTAAKARFHSGGGRDLERLDASYSVISEQLRKAAELFRSCDRVDSARIPFEIIKSLETVAQSFTGRPTTIVVHLSTQYNYEITSMRREFDAAKWSRHWQAPVTPDGEESELLLMVFPSYELGTTLLHATAAHELAHELAHRWRRDIDDAVAPIVETVNASYAQEKIAFIESIALSTRGTPSSVGFDRAWRVFRYRDELISTRWVRETFADIVAARLVGPAFIGAFDRMSVGSGSPEPLTHPPAAVRREVVGEYLRLELPHVAEDTTWNDVMAGRTGAATGDVLTKCGIEICKRSVPVLARLVNELSTPLAVKKTLRTDVETAAKNLLNLVPPSVNVAAATPGDVFKAFWFLLYATWHFRQVKKQFSELCERYDWIADTRDGDAALNSLLLHSLQNLDIMQRWAVTEVQDEA